MGADVRPALNDVHSEPGLARSRGAAPTHGGVVLSRCVGPVPRRAARRFPELHQLLKVATITESPPRLCHTTRRAVGYGSATTISWQADVRGSCRRRRDSLGSWSG